MFKLYCSECPKCADSAFGENTSPDGLKAANLVASNASTSNKVMSAGVNALGSSLVNAAVYHQRVSAEGLAANTAGAMVGTYAGDKSLNVLLANQRAHVQTQRARSTQGGHHLHRQPAPHHTGQRRLDAVKEAKQTRATRWADSSNATSWQDKYKEGPGAGTGSWQDQYMSDGVSQSAQVSSARRFVYGVENGVSNIPSALGEALTTPPYMQTAKTIEGMFMTAVMYMTADRGTRAEMLGNIVGSAGPFIVAGGVVGAASRGTSFFSLAPRASLRMQAGEVGVGVGESIGFDCSKIVNDVFAEVEKLQSSIHVSNVNSAEALSSKLSAMQKARATAAKIEVMPDGSIRYYLAETPSRTPGPTRGASYVTEYNPNNGTLRSWMESYDQAGSVVRIHPKMLNGQTLNSLHFPPTGKELLELESMAQKFKK